MTQATHTPAPWDWQDGVLIGDLDGEGGDVSFAEIGNARLIAAAPDLLSALENLTVLFDRMDRSGATNKAAYNDAIAAITKAKGLTA